MTIYALMSLPSTARIDRKVAKKLFYDNGNLASSDKKLFDNIKKIYWRYALKTENTLIQQFTDEKREYHEVEVFEIFLRHGKQLNRLAEVIMRSIPYPMLIFFCNGEKVQLWLGKLRKNQADISRMTLIATEQTHWLTMNDVFWESLSIKKMPTTNFCTLYEAWFDSVSLSHLADAGVSGRNLSGKEARKILESLKKIDQKMTCLRNQMKIESQFNRKIELNTLLQNLKREKAKIITQGSITL